MRRSAAIRGGSWYTREPSKEPAFARIGHYEFTEGQITGFRVKFRTDIQIKEKGTEMVRRNDGSDSPFAELGRGAPAVINEDLRARVKELRSENERLLARVKELRAENERLRSVIASLMPGDSGRVE